MRQIATDFEGEAITLTIEDDGRIHCVDCDTILDVTLEDLDPAGSAPICRICALAGEILTPAEAAQLTGTHESTWRNRCARGAIRCFKKGKQWLIPREALNMRRSEKSEKGNFGP